MNLLPFRLTAVAAGIAVLTACGGGTSSLAPQTASGLSVRSGSAAGPGKPHFIQYYTATGTFASILSLARGRDGAIYVTQQTPPAIGRMDGSGKYTSFPVSTDGEPVAIAAAPDGNIWFTINGASTQAIGKLTPAGTVTTYSFGQALGSEFGITAGPDGNVWFTDATANAIGKITPAGKIAEYPVPEMGQPQDIVTGPDGNLWVSELGALMDHAQTFGRILRVTTSGAFTEFPIAPHSWMTTVAAETVAHGKIWFAENDTAEHVDSITTSGRVAVFGIKNGGLYGLTTMQSGNIWLSEPFIGDLGRLDTAGGKISLYGLPAPKGFSNAQPRGIVQGPGGDVWFTEVGSGQIGRFEQ